MTKLIETNEFTPEIYQIETTDPVLGGPPHLGNKEGIANIQSQQLANRTKWLRAQIEAIQNGYVTDAELGTALANLVDAAPAHLNTLKELSDAITDNVDLIAALEALDHTMSASEILAALKTVDGAGSGLDADLLDGKQAASFVQTNRRVSAGTGLTGGGALSSNRTISANIASKAEAEAGTINTKLMTPLRVTEAIAKLVDAAPDTLDTLNELAAALGDDPNFAATMAALIGTKLNSSGGTMTGKLIIGTDDSDGITFERDIHSLTIGIFRSGVSAPFSIDGVGAAKLYPAGISATNVLTIMTREKGDARYAPLNEQISPGTVISFAATTPPINYLECDGSAISRTSYADLFAAIGTGFGVGDGATTFNLPDLRGEFLRGWDHGRGVDVGRALGTSQTDEFKAHNHVQGFAATTGESSRYGNTDTGLNVTQPDHEGDGNWGGNTTGANTSTEGGAETRPRNIAMMFCIKY